MEEDIVVNAYFSDNARFADLINGLVFGGEQVISKEDLKKEDTQTVSTKRYPRAVGFGGDSQEASLHGGQLPHEPV